MLCFKQLFPCIIVASPLFWHIQGGPKVGIQYIVYKLLFTYFWPTLYNLILYFFSEEGQKEEPTWRIFLILVLCVSSSVF